VTDRRPWRDGRTGAHLSHPDAFARLATARVILLGEQHDRPEDLRWQALVTAVLAALGPVTVGLEMLPRAAQPALDDWSAGRADLARFLAAVRWPEVWGFDPDLYRPVLELCRDLGLPMLGLNVARPVVSEVGRDGWDALPPADRAWLSPARPARPAYRRYLFDVTGGARPDRTARGPDDPAFDRFVRAQQVWDRAFACAIAAALEAGAGRVAALIGRGHLEFGYGTPDQLADLGIGGVVTALPDRGRPTQDPDGAPLADLIFSHVGIEENHSSRDA